MTRTKPRVRDPHAYHLALPGLPLMVSENVPRDSGFIDRSTGRIWLHPLAVIYLEHEDDPFARLAAIEAYIVDRAHRQLEQLARKMIDDTDRVAATLAAFAAERGRS